MKVHISKIIIPDIIKEVKFKSEYHIGIDISPYVVVNKQYEICDLHSYIHYNDCIENGVDEITVHIDNMLPLSGTERYYNLIFYKYSDILDYALQVIHYFNLYEIKCVKYDSCYDALLYASNTTDVKKWITQHSKTSLTELKYYVRSLKAKRARLQHINSKTLYFFLHYLKKIMKTVKNKEAYNEAYKYLEIIYDKLYNTERCPENHGNSGTSCDNCYLGLVPKGMGVRRKYTHGR